MPDPVALLPGNETCDGFASRELQNAVVRVDVFGELSRLACSGCVGSLCGFSLCPTFDDVTEELGIAAAEFVGLPFCQGPA